VAYQSFLRWAGGKRWLAKICAPPLAERLTPENRYIEPLVGSGAMYFAVAPNQAYLGDVNEELIEAYRVVRDEAENLERELLRLDVCAEEYERVRRWRPRTPLNRATRFIYLNRTAYGGLYRTNLNGQFNVPYGGGERNARRMVEAGILSLASECLRSTDLELHVGDFERPISTAEAGDVIYCDPTYREVTRTVYDRYGPHIYSWEDQERLARVLREANARGALVLVSGLAWIGLRDLFPEAGLIELKRRKGIGPGGSDVTEYLFILDPEREWLRWEKIGTVSRPVRRIPRSDRLVTLPGSGVAAAGLKHDLASDIS
jgi:DNA adenine methylase